MLKLLLVAVVIALAGTANAAFYTWKFHSVTGSPADGQITSTDSNYPFDITLPTPAVASSSSFSLKNLGLTLDLAAPLNNALQPVGVGLVPALAPDGGSSLWLGPFQGNAPALTLAGINFTINPAENFPQSPDPQQWQYTGSGGPLSGTGYWELAPVPEPSTSALLLISVPPLWFAARRVRSRLTSDL
jgi:hypothetical protein